MTESVHINVKREMPTGYFRTTATLTDEKVAAITRLIDLGADLRDIALLLDGEYREIK